MIIDFVATGPDENEVLITDEVIRSVTQLWANVYGVPFYVAIDFRERYLYMTDSPLPGDEKALACYPEISEYNNGGNL